jgi:hypothetical protein
MRFVRVVSASLAVIALVALGSCADEKSTIPPTVTIDNPHAGDTVSGQVVFTGTATDDGKVVKVEVMIDEDDLLPAEGTALWTFPLDTTKLSNDNHRIEVHATDDTGLLGKAAFMFTASNGP